MWAEVVTVTSRIANLMNDPIVIRDSSLSVAWLRALDAVVRFPGSTGPPLVVVVDSFVKNVPTENHVLRDLMDKELARQGKTLSTGTAFTIFPYGCWVRRKPSRDELYALYLERIFPRLQKRCVLNRYGTRRELLKGLY